MQISKRIILSLMLLSNVVIIKPTDEQTKFLLTNIQKNVETLLKGQSYIHRNMARRFSVLKSTTLFGLVLSWPFLFKKSYPTVWQEVKENTQTIFSTVSGIISKKLHEPKKSN